MKRFGNARLDSFGLGRREDAAEGKFGGLVLLWRLMEWGILGRWGQNTHEFWSKYQFADSYIFLICQIRH